MKSEVEHSKDSMSVLIGKVILSLLVGFLVGVFFHYLLYRIEIPGKPFIYVAF